MEFLAKNKRVLFGVGGLVCVAAAVVDVQVDDATAGAFLKVVGVVGGAVVAALAGKFAGPKPPAPAAEAPK